MGKVTTAVERKLYYLEMCRAYQFDPLSFPFDYIESEGKLKLYINSVGASQLRDRFEISISIKSREYYEDMWIVTALARKGNRTEEATGAASVVDKYGKTSPDRKANALKKAETQARRRATLAISGFGWDDEESGNIIKASLYDPPEDIILTALPASNNSNNEIWRNWKTPKDAIAWAKSQLPYMTDEQLQHEFDSLNPANGKKAPGWVERVNTLKDF
jgi:hypothetical protein